MSLEHSRARQKKSGCKALAPSALEPLYTRDEVAARYRVTKSWVTRNYRRLGLRPLNISKRRLFPHSQLVELDRRALTGDVQF